MFSSSTSRIAPSISSFSARYWGLLRKTGIGPLSLMTQHSSLVRPYLQPARLLAGHVRLVPVVIAVSPVELDRPAQPLAQRHARLPAQFAADLFVTQVGLAGIDGAPLRRQLGQLR